MSIRISLAFLLVVVWGCDESEADSDGGKGQTVDLTSGDPSAAQSGGSMAMGTADGVQVGMEMEMVPEVGGASASDAQPPGTGVETGMEPGPLDPPAAMDFGALCSPCQSAADCAAGGACLTNNTTNERFCGGPCTANDDCPRGAVCLTLEAGEQQCAPPSGSCSDFPPSDVGATCTTDADCQNDTSRCILAGERAYCTAACVADAQCPVGFSSCREGLCQADWMTGPQGCGRNPAADLPPCGAGGECDDGMVCLSEVMANYPVTPAGLCSQTCTGDEDCPGETTCHSLGGNGRYCLTPECSCLAPWGDPPVLDNALRSTAVHRCEAGFPTEVMGLLLPRIVLDPFRLSFFNGAHQNAFDGLLWARDTKADLEGQETMAGLIQESAALLDQGIPPYEPGPEVSALEGARAIWGPSDQAFPEADVAQALMGLPAALDPVLGQILWAQAAVIQARQMVVTTAQIPDILMADLFNVMPGTLATQPDFTGINMRNPVVKNLLLGGFNLTQILNTGRNLAATIEAQDWDSLVGLETTGLVLETPFGSIVVQGGEDHVLENVETPLLLLDTGGDDRYLVPVGATTAWTKPVSVSIDLDGSDHYGFPGSDGEAIHPELAPADAAGRYDGSHSQVGDQFGPMSLSMIPRQGAGILGVGILYDHGGNDFYRSHKVSQGIGVLGLGMLMDKGGSDRYACEQGCQGAAAYGVGLLMDRAGSDRYVAVQHVQGYAHVRGVGVLHDGHGNDRYTALMGDPERDGIFLYPNPQNPTSNSSFAQGAGFGRRADQSDQIFASGGLGVLLDVGEGSDRYTVDVFGQGTGYWFGTGIFNDGGGDDTYRGRWYTQGSGAHFAMAFFFEEGGNDDYNPDGETIATAVGQGHDLSLGWLVDYGGDDRYWAPGLGLGGGNDNGIGIFADLGGDDIYNAPDGTTYGGSAIGDRGEAFDTALSLGVFLDTSGTDQYPTFEEGGLIGNERTWSWSERRDNPKPGARGAGSDGTYPNFTLP